MNAVLRTPGGLMNEMMLTGNVVSDPEYVRTNNGNARVRFRMAHTDRKLDRAAGEWVDAGTVYLTVTCWRALADNVAESLHKGEAVIVYGRLTQRQVEQPGGDRTTYTDLTANLVAHDLGRGTTTFRRTRRDQPVPGRALMPVPDATWDSAEGSAPVPTRVHDGWSAPGVPAA